MELTKRHAALQFNRTVHVTTRLRLSILNLLSLCRFSAFIILYQMAFKMIDYMLRLLLFNLILFFSIHLETGRLFALTTYPIYH